MESRLQSELAEELLARGFISGDQLAVARVSQKNYGTDLSEILIKRGYVTKEMVAETLSLKTKLPLVCLEDYNPSPELRQILPQRLINRGHLVPFSLNATSLVIAIAEPVKAALLDEIKREFAHDLSFVLAFPAQIEKCLKKFFDQPDESPESQSFDLKHELGADYEHNGKKTHEIDLASLKAVPNDLHGSDAVKLLDLMLAQCVERRASDLHIEPNAKTLRVRMRVDGLLQAFMELPINTHQKILSRIKILCHLDVAENRRPQDGSTNIKLGSQKIDLRIATYPTIHGEAAAIRISLHSGLITLEALGLSPRCQKIFEELVKRPDGIVLVTGPTGSGKTTSLYAALQKIDCLTKHVLTAEDPAEHQIEGVVQTEINTKAGVTFPVILRSMLREDPDVIMVGEIRDKETAEISLRAAMTGHLVLSTLHTNTAVGAVARLNDIGLDTYLVASTLRGVMAQRLVRRLCQSCKVEMPIAEAHARVLGFKGRGLVGFVGKGCNQCNGTGFHGRLGLFELVVVDDEFRILISNRAPEVRLQEKASALGTKTILEDGIEKIAAGLTTVEEVLRVCWRQ